MNFKTETLEEWLVSQIKRGCTLESMVTTMQESGYEMAVAQSQVVTAFINAGLLTHHDNLLPNNHLLGHLQTSEPLPNLKFEQLPKKIIDDSITKTQEKQALLAWQMINARHKTNIKPLINITNPRVMVIEGFLTNVECDSLVLNASNQMQDSRVLDPVSGDFVLHPERLSRGMHFEHQSNQLIASIENRIDKLFGFNIKHQEAMQILHYAKGGEYRPHFDFFPPTESGSYDAIEAAGQRLATLIMYLNTPEMGGETSLPNIGLTVSAKKGNAIYFENIDQQGKPNLDTLHAGMPVLSGEKWIATKWLRERPLF